MRTKLLSFLLIISFLTGVAPVFAEEPLPTEPVTEAVLVEEMAEPVEEPAATPETPSATSTETAVALEAPVSEDMPSEIMLVIRHGKDIAWSGTTTLPTGGTVPVTPTGGGESVEVPADTLLGVLVTLDAAEDEFSLSKLDYYPAWPPFPASFLIDCITADAFGKQCREWQYMVNGEYAQVGADQTTLQNGDTVYLYFGSPFRVSLPDASVETNIPFEAVAESYDPSEDQYEPFTEDLRERHLIGITQPNPADAWTPLEIATSSLSGSATSTFSVGAAGVYSVQLKDIAGGFYLFPATALTVTEASSGGGGGGSSDTPSFDVEAAFDFLAALEPDGFVSDWSAVAHGVSGAPSDTKSSLAAYLRSEEPRLRSALDYERHAMALMALNIDPYTGGPSDYITPIIDSFDGRQIDDPTIMNDDVFALVTLLHAGYSKNDTIIKEITDFIVSEQRGNGSWEGSVDMTAATIQALAEVRSLPGVAAALGEAKNYLRASQQPDGGFHDPFATAWVLQAIAALGETPPDWKVGDESPLTYLVKAQEEGGGISTPRDDSYLNRAWATAYAIPAAKGLTWNDLLHEFEKPESTNTSRGSNGTAKDTATSTDDVLVLDAEPVQLIAPLPPEVMEATVSLPILEASTPIEPTVVTAPVPGSVSDIQTENTVPAEAVVDEVAQTNPLVASAAESGAWEKLKSLLSSFWSFLIGLFA